MCCQDIATIWLLAAASSRPVFLLNLCLFFFLQTFPCKNISQTKGQQKKAINRPSMRLSEFLFSLYIFMLTLNLFWTGLSFHTTIQAIFRHTVIYCRLGKRPFKSTSVGLDDLLQNMWIFLWMSKIASKLSYPCCNQGWVLRVGGWGSLSLQLKIIIGSLVPLTTTSLYPNPPCHAIANLSMGTN